MGRPLFWALFVGVMVCVPLLKGTQGTLPDPPPGMDRAPLDFSLSDETGRQVSLSDLRGHLVIIGEVPLANAPEARRGIEGLWALRKRLRGLGSAVVFVSLCHGADAATLKALIEERHAQRPLNIFLLDDDRATAAWLRREAGSESADLILLDRHGRVRAVAAGDQPGVDKLVATAGVLANWAGADPEPAN